MEEKKKKKGRRTKAQVAVDRAIQTLTDLKIDVESEKGQEMLRAIREKYENGSSSGSVNPELSKAKKNRLAAKRALEKLNTAAKQIEEASKMLCKDKINEAMKNFNAANEEVEKLDGEKIVANIDHLNNYIRENEDDPTD
jgi:hypothetical protein